MLFVACTCWKKELGIKVILFSYIDSFLNAATLDEIKYSGIEIMLLPLAVKYAKEVQL